ncbi:hypothetical protein DYB25_000003 [Aphanomyces astaci]|uniref:Uncharacterized protein n=1 Tax=Aphanomyces astaci TaxID=112090 RepID=A0A397BBU3_APHAT|nr:hypothetical protein DYB25_000003 [Aphanomyces astaci]
MKMHIGAVILLVAAATHTTTARTCGDKSPLDEKCADLFPTCPDQHSPAIFNGCYHCAHDVTCEIKAFAVVNVKEMVAANEDVDRNDKKETLLDARENTRVRSHASSSSDLHAVASVTSSDEENNNGWAVPGVLGLLGVGVAVGGVYRHKRSRGQYHSILSQQQQQYDADDAALDDLNPFCHGSLSEETPSLLKPSPKASATSSSFRILTKLQAAVRDLRVACRVSYAFQINEDKMTSWKTASLGTVLKSVHVTPEVQAKIHAVYDDAIVQMRTLLDETYDRTVAEMTHRLDAFEKVGGIPKFLELTAQAAASHASLVDDLELRYAATKLELEHVIADMHKEHDHQRMQIIYLETRLKALEGAPDRGDVELCNQLRTRVVELEAAVEASAARVAQVQNDNATAVSQLHYNQDIFHT